MKTAKNMWLSGRNTEIGRCDLDKPSAQYGKGQVQQTNLFSSGQKDDPDLNLTIGGQEVGEMVPIPTTVVEIGKGISSSKN